MMRKLATALVFTGVLGSSFANALGLGELTLHSALNQKLNAEVKLLNVGDLSRNEILPNLASHEEFARAGVERIFFLTSIRFDVRLKSDGSGVIKLTTDKIVREPFLNFLVELHWPSGRILREYTVLLDPPIFSETPASAVSQATTRPAPPKAPDPRPEKSAEKTVSRPSVASSRPSTPSPRPTRAGTDGEEVTVKKNDTLWGIARDHRPSNEVTIRQTMLAIQRNNPHAFIRNNINLLKAGQKLRIPSVDQVRSLSSAEASAEIARQNEAWRSNRTIDATQKEQPEQMAQEPVVEEPVAQGQLKLLTDDAALASENVAASASGASVSGEQETDVEQGTLATSLDGEETELAGDDTAALNSEQVQELQEQVESLKRLLDLKDQQLALLQASGQNPEQAANSPSNTANEADSAEANKDQGIIATLTENALYIGLMVLGVLVGLVMLGAISRRKREEQEYASALEETLESDENEVYLPEDLEQELESDDVAQVASGDEQQPAQPFEDTGSSEAGETNVQKLIEEADIYIAYGRYERALETLQPAANEDPQDVDLHLKLAEIYIATGDEAGLSQQEADLQALNDADALLRLDALKSENHQRDAVSEEPVETSISADELVQSETDVDEVLADLDVEPEQAPEEERVADSTDELDNLVDFELPEAANETADELQQKESEQLDGDLVEFTLDDSDTDADQAALAPEQTEQSTASADDMDFLGDTDESATKLELARAYIDMADKDAAEDILNEVMEEGSDEQREEARKLLDSLA